MNKRNLALMAASITLMTFASTWPISAVADPTQALQRDRPGQRQRIGDHGQAALKFVTAAQVEATTLKDDRTCPTCKTCERTCGSP
jgi:hypothetical protein